MQVSLARLVFQTCQLTIMPSEHNLLMQHCLENIDEIITIGWKGTEVKFHDLLNRKLGKRQIKIINVSNNDPTVIKEFKKSIPLAEYKESAPTFTKFMQGLATTKSSIF